MKSIISSILILLLYFSAFGQGSTGLRDIQPDSVGEAKINKILEDSGNAFKEGLLNLNDARRPQAREKFDQAVEVFLRSNVNVRSNAKLQNCYNQLVETIYRIEFPSARQQPQIKSLTMTCGWDIKSELADNVVKMTQTVQSNPSTSNTTVFNEKELIKSAYSSQSDGVQSGFLVQANIPSPLDELAKLEFTPEEAKIVKNNFKYSCAIPALQNIKPGYSLESVEKIVGRKLTFTPDKVYGSLGVKIAYLKNPNILGMYVRFYKNYVYQIAVYYDNSIKWKGIRDFSNTVSNNLQLPNSWKYSENKAFLNCSSFSLIAQFSKTYGLQITDEKLDFQILTEIANIKKQKEADEAKKKSTFKP